MAEKELVIRISAKDLSAPDLAKAREALAGIGLKAREVSGETQAMGGVVQTAIGIMGGFIGAQAILGGVRSMFSFAKDAAIGMNATLETSTLQFETLMGDADAAREHVRGLFEFAKRTPFETQPIIDASKYMRTFGGDALDTKQNLLLIGDASAATKAPISELGMWVGRLYANLQAGKPIGEAAQRLGEMAVLTPQARMELEAMSDAGKSADEIFARFQGQLGRFSGAMEKQAGTWSGVVSTFKDTAQIVIAESAKPLFDTLRDGLASVNTWLDNNQDTLKRWQAGARESIVGVVGFLKDDLWPAVEDVGRAVVGVLKTGADFVRWLNGLPQPVKDVAVTMGVLAVGLWGVNSALAAIGGSAGVAAIAKLGGVAVVLEKVGALVASVPGGLASLAGVLGVGVTSGFLSAATSGQSFASVQSSIAQVLGRSGGIVDQTREGLLRFEEQVTVTGAASTTAGHKYQSYIDKIKAGAEAQKKAEEDAKRFAKALNDVTGKADYAKAVEAMRLMEAAGRRIDPAQAKKLAEQITAGVAAGSRLGIVVPDNMRRVAAATLEAQGQVGGLLDYLTTINARVASYTPPPLTLKATLDDSLVRAGVQESTQETIRQLDEVRRVYGDTESAGQGLLQSLRSSATGTLSSLKTAISGTFAQMVLGAKDFRGGMDDIWSSLKASAVRIFAEIADAFIGGMLKRMIAGVAGQKATLSGSLAGLFGSVGSAAAATNLNDPNTFIGPTQGGSWTSASGLAKAAGPAGGLLAGGLTGYQTGSKLKGALSGAATGAMAGMAAGPVGALFGAGVGALSGVIGGIFGGQKQSRQADADATAQIQTFKAQLLETYGSLENIRTLGQQTGVDLAGAWGDQSRKGLEHFTGLVEQFTAKLGEHNARLAEQKRIEGEIVDIEGRIAQVKAGQIPTWREMSGLISQYGIEVGGLGGAIKQMALTDEATTYINVIERLTAGNADLGGVLKGMGDEIGELVKKSIDFGVAIPENMRPWIEQLVKSGDLVDANGKKITDISKVKWGDPVETEAEKSNKTLQSLNDTLVSLRDLLAKSLPDAAATTAKALRNALEDPPWPKGGWPSPFDGGALEMPSGRGADVPGFARGVRNFRGGFAVVGESGPELVRLPRGADVLPSTGTAGAFVPTASASRSDSVSISAAAMERMAQYVARAVAGVTLAVESAVYFDGDRTTDAVLRRVGRAKTFRAG